MISRILSSTALLLALLLLSACGGGDKDHDHKDHDHEDKGHVHVAPRGGTLVELGEHAANVEFVVDPIRKTFALYVLDAHAENAAKIAQPAIEIVILASKQGTKEKPLEDFSIALAAVANENTGEKVGDTSQFEISLDALKGLTDFDGLIKSVTVKGAAYKDVKFSFKGKSGK